ncbi:hypothetical protein F2Q68_00011487 [Brassica cretica]|uniref:Uncharacterized protein n=1 Tax=Brassica cretica TaxID=69181 RepID=A0A8S9KVA6_BRACR|nr:hypothetical protein F2Q68_00011487 [Brassica cretica]
MLSVPEPVSDHTRISQYTVGSTALNPDSPPHGLPSIHPGPATRSLEPCTSVHYPIQPILLQPFLFSMPPVRFASSQYDQSDTILLYRPYPNHLRLKNIRGTLVVTPEFDPSVVRFVGGLLKSIVPGLDIASVGKDLEMYS